MTSASAACGNSTWPASEVAFRHQGHINFQLQVSKRVDSVPLTRDYMFDWEREHAPKAKRKERAA